MPVVNGWRENDDSLQVTRTGRTQVLELGREEDESEAGGEWTMVGRGGKPGGRRHWQLVGRTGGWYSSVNEEAVGGGM